MLPAFRGIVDIELETFDAARLAERCDAVFMGLPGGDSMTFGAALHDAGVRIFDLGSDFRLKDAALYPWLRTAYETDSRRVIERLIGLAGVAVEPLAPRGYVRVRGELWQAEPAKIVRFTVTVAWEGSGRRRTFSPFGSAYSVIPCTENCFSSIGRFPVIGSRAEPRPGWG